MGLGEVVIEINDLVLTTSKGTSLEGLDNIDSEGYVQRINRNHLGDPSYLVHGFWFDDEHIKLIEKGTT